MTIIKKFETQEKKSSLPKKYLIMASFLIFILAITEIWASNTLVTYGDKLDNLFRLSKGLEMENKILDNEIAKASSLAGIASKSAELGFSKADSIQYIH